eukprot:gene9427-36926_t
MGGRDAASYDTAHDELYLRYIAARLASKRNVWWSMANEWDLHYYNHSRPWITHISSQGGYDLAHIKRRFAPKPLIWDEVMYEGDIPSGWGGLTAGQMADRFWW